PAPAFFLVSTVNVDMPEFTTDGGLNLTLEFLGAPLWVSVTVPVKPAPPVIVTVYVATPPLLIVTLGGAAEIAKSPLTTSVTLTLWLTGPLVPVIVSVYVPTGVEVLVETLIVVDPDPLTDAGLNEAVAPVGSPVTLNATVPLNPVPGVTVAVYVVPAPPRTVLDDGVADNEKSVTVIVRVAG